MENALRRDDETEAHAKKLEGGLEEGKLSPKDSPGGAVSKREIKAVADRLGLYHFPGTSNLAEHVKALFYGKAMHDGLTVMRHFVYTSNVSPEKFFKATEAQILFSGGVGRSYTEFYIGRLPGGLVFHLAFNQEKHTVTVACSTNEQAEKFRKIFEEHIPPTIVKTDHISVRFWSAGDGSGDFSQRNITAPTWEDVQENYPEATREALRQLAALQSPPPDLGKLILFHGEPGTGKTYAIRALAKHWNSWCDIDYIVDADKFFFEATYLMNTIMYSSHDNSGDEEDYLEPTDYLARMLTNGNSKKKKKYRLLVVEDADQFLTMDAKDRNGQSMSRILNLLDGMVGQGLDLLVLFTTNEELGKINPAVSRDGRCVANIHFNLFPVHEAAKWCEKRGIEAPTAESPLASLYARSRGSLIKLTKKESKVGF